MEFFWIGNMSFSGQQYSFFVAYYQSAVRCRFIRIFLINSINQEEILSFLLNLILYSTTPGLLGEPFLLNGSGGVKGR